MLNTLNALKQNLKQNTSYRNRNLRRTLLSRLSIAGLLLLAGSRPALTQQFGAPPPPLRPAVDVQNASRKRNLNFGSVSILPFAVFDVGGAFTSSTGTQSLFGNLVDFEYGTQDISHTRTKGRYTIGGWYWGRDGNDLFELHIRAQAPKGIGLQVGYLNTTQSFIARPGPIGQTVSTDAEAIDMFLLYGFSSYSVASKAELPNLLKRKAGNWSVEIGAGLYIDTSTHYLFNQGTFSSNATANYTFYVSGSLQLRGNLSLLLTEWVLRNREQELNRVGIGLGYNF